jgi:hypothetical protein
MNSLERDVWDVSWTVVEMTSRRFFAAPRRQSGDGASAPTPGRRHQVVTSASGTHIL